MKNTTRPILLCLTFACCFLISCRSTQRQETQKIEIKSDSVSEKVVTYKDSTLYAPKAETTIKIPVKYLDFKEDLNGNKKPIYYTQKNGQATATFRAENDTIYLSATCDSLAIVAKIKSEFQKQTSNKSKSDLQKSEVNIKSGYSLLEVSVYAIVAFAIGFVLCFLLKTFKLL